ncbi:MAG TPA: sigma-70 family RNA polymerase sigma factor [Patescibacteria group bacterium]|nr:sigma-70 family RNA polymerase sigma factor [Patescibacteria group bacterium]
MDNRTENFEKMSDNDLIAAALTNRHDFVFLVERYQKRLLRYILRLTNVSNEEAEDILQNIFIKTYLNLNDFDDSQKFSSWLYRISHNEVIDNYRRFKSRPQVLNVDINDSQIKEMAAEVDILEEISRLEINEKIKIAISKLDIIYQEVLILKFIEEKEYKEIAFIIKKPLGTVASRINKAKLELKKQLLKLGEI